LKGKAGISFSDIDVRSAGDHQYFVSNDFLEQRTRFPTPVSPNEAIAATAFDAQMCTAQDLKPGSTGLGTFTFRSGRIWIVGTLSAQQDYTQIVYVNLGSRVSVAKE